MAKRCLLVGDIGGTNARFALADARKPGFSNERVYWCADFDSPSIAITNYLADVDALSPDVICYQLISSFAHRSWYWQVAPAWVWSRGNAMSSQRMK